jgi:hypothetical protein
VDVEEMVEVEPEPEPELVLTQRLEITVGDDRATRGGGTRGAAPVTWVESFFERVPDARRDLASSTRRDLASSMRLESASSTRVESACSTRLLSSTPLSLTERQGGRLATRAEAYQRASRAHPRRAA